MRNLNDPRHIARVVAVMDLYEYFFDFGIDGVIKEKVDYDNFEIGNYSKKLQSELVEGVKSTTEEVDEIINKYSDPVKASDLDIVLLQIIRLAIWEGFVSKITPQKVAIDEAIEITREFGLDMQAKKVAGILGKVFENLKEKESKE